MRPFFANRAAEVNHLLLEGRELCPGMEEVCWVEGNLNPADVGTRPGSKMSQIGEGSIWQEGPAFHQLPRSQWPLDTKASGDVPREELRQGVEPGGGFIGSVQAEEHLRKVRVTSLVSALGRLPHSQGMEVVTASSQISRSVQKSALREEVRAIISQATSLSRAVGTVACLLSATISGERSKINTEEPSMKQ